MNWRKILRNLLPPFILEVRYALLRRESYPLLSQNTWTDLAKIDLDNDLKIQVDNYLESLDFNRTSKYWRFLILKNLVEIEKFGIDCYAESIARNYFTWTNFEDSQIENLNIEGYSPNAINIYKLHQGFNLSESIRHNILMQLLLSYCDQNNLTEYIMQLGDDGYTFGNHPRHSVNGKVITLDMLASVLDYKSLAPILKDESIFCEIGAGSGRTAEALLTLHPNCHYIIVDLPPASFIAMKRLQLAFPEKRICYISSQSELTAIFPKLGEWDVIFCLPSLLEFLPKKSIDILLAIDCLHEMSNKMRQFVAGIASNKSDYFFIKIWKETKIPLDNIHLDGNNLLDYFVSEDWVLLKRNNSIFPSNFMEMTFRT
jgi:putative sugar O-methyltransferase